MTEGRGMNEQHARSLMQSGNYQGALSLYESWAEKTGTPGRAYLGKARALEQLGRIEEALDAAEAAGKLLPRNLDGWWIRARCHNKLGQSGQSEACCRQVLALNPVHAGAAAALARLYVKGDAAERAMAVVAGFHQAGGTDARVSLVHAGILISRRAYGDAEAILRGLLDDGLETPQRQNAVRRLADLYITLKDFPALRALCDGHVKDDDDKIRIAVRLCKLPPADLGASFPFSFFRELYENNAGDTRAFNAFFIQASLAGEIEDTLGLEISHAAIADTSNGDICGLLKRLEPPAPETAAKPENLEFWHLCGQPCGSFTAWAARALWNREATAALARYLGPHRGNRAEVMKQLNALCAQPDFALLAQQRSRGKGCLVAGSHLGPIRALPPFLEDRLDSVGVISDLRRHRSAEGQNDISVRLNPGRSFREIAMCLKRNAILCCAPDGIWPTDPKRFFDSEFGPVALQTLYARAQYASGASCVWAEAYWQDGEIRFGFRPMPCPRAGEGREAFVQRWGRSYLMHTVELLKNRLPAFYDGHRRFRERG
ncbi:hypothetical protein RA21_17255 [Leisingera sp. ANG-DT]|nr:hypothetical protein RA21_17255 [Leisingera sp. ANG-DT]